MFGSVTQDGPRADQAIMFMQRLKGRRPWVLQTEGGRTVEVATFIPTSATAVAECRSWIISRQRKGKGILLVLGELAQPIYRPFLDREIISSAVIGFGHDRPADQWPASLAPSAVINTGRAMGALYLFPAPLPRATLAKLTETLKGHLAALSPIAAGLMPLPGLLRPDGKQCRVIQFDPKRIFPPDAIKPTTRAGPRFVIGSEMGKPKSVDWLWPNLIPLGDMTAIMGEPKIGKSQAGLDALARVTVGAPWPTGEPGSDPAGVVAIECEDAKEVTQARLIAMGADMSRVALDNQPLDLSSAAGLAELTDIADRVNARAVLLSPARQFFGSREAHGQVEMRNRLDPLLNWAAERRAAIIAITHKQSGAKGTSAEDMAGSQAIAQRCRSILVASVDETDPVAKVNRKSARRMLASAGGNSGADDFQLPYKIQGVTVEGAATSRVVWLPRDASYQDAPGPAFDADDPSGVVVRFPGIARQSQGVVAAFRPDCASWLRDQLMGGPRAACEILAAGQAAGFHRATIYRAAKSISVDRGKGAEAVALWQLSHKSR
jgi:hypothetical protein